MSRCASAKLLFLISNHCAAGAEFIRSPPCRIPGRILKLYAHAMMNKESRWLTPDSVLQLFFHFYDALSSGRRVLLVAVASDTTHCYHRASYQTSIAAQTWASTCEQHYYRSLHLSRTPSQIQGLDIPTVMIFKWVLSAFCSAQKKFLRHNCVIRS